MSMPKISQKIFDLSNETMTIEIEFAGILMDNLIQDQARYQTALEKATLHLTRT